MIENVAWKLWSLLAGCVLTALGLLAGHWFPWVNELTRVRAYAVGTFLIWAGFTLWRGLNGDWEGPAGLLMIIVVAGGVVLWAYHRDETVRKLRQAEMAQAADDELSIPI